MNFKILALFTAALAAPHANTLTFDEHHPYDANYHTHYDPSIYTPEQQRTLWYQAQIMQNYYATLNAFTDQYNAYQQQIALNPTVPAE